MTHSGFKRFTTLVLVLLLSACTTPRYYPTPSQSPPAAPAEKNVTIALLGATGMVGRFLLAEALDQGYNIKALARTPSKLNAHRDKITIVQGDARNPATIDELLQGSDIVISALGPVRRDGESARGISTGVGKHIVASMEKHNIPRYIAVSGAGVSAPGDRRNFTGWLTRTLAKFAYYNTLKDKQSEYELLAESSIQWTLVRSPIIKAQPYLKPPRVSLASPSSMHLRAGELARFIIEDIAAEAYPNKAPFLDSR